MIILTNTTDKIQVKLGGNVTTNQLPCYVSYRETTSTTIEPKRNVLNTNNTTEVDLIGSPPSSSQRIADYLSVYNSDTVSATVTIQFNDNGTIYNLFVGILGIGEKLEYQEGIGFKVISTNGEVLKDNIAGLPSSSPSMGYVYKSTDQTTTSTTFVDITGLSFSVEANKTYWFRFVIPFTSVATTIGSKFAVNGPASPIMLYYSTDVSNAVNNIGINRGISTYNGTATTLASAATTANTAYIEGMVKPSSNGTLIASFGSEANANAVTQKAGAAVFYIEL